VEWVDYKDVNTLRRLMSDRGKIKARRVTGTCRQHQRDVATAIKTARELALLPYALTPMNADKPRRGGPRDSRGPGENSRRDGEQAAADVPDAEDVDVDDLDVEPEVSDEASDVDAV